ncbi:MAG: hypothetical protein COV74_05180 [Candidatus Omnitrophica bacterium CG11_big_fil_rev_8_21_14_0_20_45_26]|uniref:Metalloenzyme domain-containing protein n=1 Tax=Candidatus Abzuiibacterium crystallinum TaxID=1974748 RepID=A0A2H0LPQ4_9BACT|nr:MAG: hypothetical protein COV74_05180 [Candidatus Omnitrophica bacterium CG11_big_fil_rev_8_21_14_0_20_45_26]PIW63545.1 MAG: hypothetical protein COW12_10090 [Candidatus Omnitrophica bacterium CG12_big_fil_rev_8_21_14_0_65_45_16]
MKYILLMIDGISDHPSEELGGKTPLEVSKIPHFHFLAKSGKVGSVSHIPDFLEPTASVAAVSVFGYNPKDNRIGLGPLEAMNLEIKLEANEVAFRANLVTESEGHLADYTGGNVSSKESRALITYLNKKLSSDFVRFFPGSGYRHVAVLKDAEGLQGLSARCVTPDQAVGKPIKDFLPAGKGAELLSKLMYDTKMLLDQHEINEVRVDLKENPANMVWLWGQGIKPELAKFSDRFNGTRGAVISTDDHVKGLGRLIGLTVIDLPHDASEVEKHFEAISHSLSELLKEKDFVAIHLHGCDEASRDGNVKRKINMLEAIDFYVLKSVRAFAEEQKDVRLLITPLMMTPWKKKVSVREAVPFILCGKNIVPDEIEKFSEAAAKLSTFKVRDGYRLIEFLMGQQETA